jgi:hypothetical protein
LSMVSQSPCVGTTRRHSKDELDADGFVDVSACSVGNSVDCRTWSMIL